MWLVRGGSGIFSNAPQYFVFIQFVFQMWVLAIQVILLKGDWRMRRTQSKMLFIVGVSGAASVPVASFVYDLLTGSEFNWPLLAFCFCVAPILLITIRDRKPRTR